jgi:hypothetical protein
MDESILAGLTPRKAQRSKALKRYMQRSAVEAHCASQLVPRSERQRELAERKRLSTFSRQQMMQEVETDGKKLQWASRKLKEHRGLVTTAVRNYGAALRHAHPDVVQDPMVAFEAAKSSPIAMEYAPARVAADRRLAMLMVKKDGLALQHLHLMQNDVPIVTAAIRQNAWAFRFASAACRADPDVVALAVEAHGRNLCYVSDQCLRSDRELLLRCIARNAWALQWASDEVRQDRDFLLRVVEVNGWALRFALPPYNTSRGLALEAAAQGCRTPPRCNMSHARANELIRASQQPLPYGKGGHDTLIPAAAALDPDARRSIRLPWREPPVRPSTHAEPLVPEQLSQSRTHPISREIASPKPKQWHLLPPSDIDGPTLEEVRDGFVVQVL